MIKHFSTKSNTKIVHIPKGNLFVATRKKWILFTFLFVIVRNYAQTLKNSHIFLCSFHSKNPAPFAKIRTERSFCSIGKETLFGVGGVTSGPPPPCEYYRSPRVAALKLAVRVSAAQVKRKRKREAPAQTELNKLSIDSSVCKDAASARQAWRDSDANVGANKVDSCIRRNANKVGIARIRPVSLFPSKSPFVAVIASALASLPKKNKKISKKNEKMF